jgi:ATP-binding cassette subfamily B protein/subfamily B ATP-binding cassette protein MsbA
MAFHHIMLEVFNSLLTVQANTMEDFERRRFRDATGHIRRTVCTATFYNSLTSPVTELLGMGMLCTGVVVSAYLVLNQETSIFGIPMCDSPLSIPSVTVFFGMLIGAADPLRKLSSVITSINNGTAAANLLYPLLEIQSHVVEAECPKSLPSPHRQIEFRDVSFSYDGIHEVLQQVSLHINRGEHLAVVGPNGQRVSGGQRQRIALARAFLRNSEILILDEATSQIDVESERLIHDALTEFGRDRTLIMITHRESTLSLATRIVRIENGMLQPFAVPGVQAA